MNTLPANVAVAAPQKTSFRIESIDLLRGLVMIIMALDHVRDYFHEDAFLYNPTDLSKTNVLLFFTRWITHYCAPTFMFLSGTSAFLVGTKKGKKYLSRFLLTRGLWLIFLEMTIINFAWYFNPSFPVTDFLVIWALGISMLALAAFIYLPLTAIAVIGFVMVFGHDMLDNIHFENGSTASIIWSFIHQQNVFFEKDHMYFIGYPIVPWIGVMALGYCFGKLYTRNYDAAKRKKLLIKLGSGALILFVLLRFINVYGDPHPWQSQPTAVFTFLSFINVSKYPPSLLYILLTIGPGILFLACTENAGGWLATQIKIFGRVPMFYYILHLYLMHIAAMIATYFSGHEWKDMVLTTWVTFNTNLKGYGFSLGVVYAVWAGLVIILFFLCRSYDKYKRSHPQYWWLSYL